MLRTGDKHLQHFILDKLHVNCPHMENPNNPNNPENDIQFQFVLNAAMNYNDKICKKRKKG
jgi:hypothetical protein